MDGGDLRVLGYPFVELFGWSVDLQMTYRNPFPVTPVCLVAQWFSFTLRPTRPKVLPDLRRLYESLEWTPDGPNHD